MQSARRQPRGVVEFEDWTFKGLPFLLAFDHTGNAIEFRTYSNEDEYALAREELWDILDERDPITMRLIS
jgi:hypothetical protein